MRKTNRMGTSYNELRNKQIAQIWDDEYLNPVKRAFQLEKKQYINVYPDQPYLQMKPQLPPQVVSNFNTYADKFANQLIAFRAIVERGTLLVQDEPPQFDINFQKWSDLFDSFIQFKQIVTTYTSLETYQSREVTTTIDKIVQLYIFFYRSIQDFIKTNPQNAGNKNADIDGNILQQINNMGSFLGSIQQQFQSFASPNASNPIPINGNTMGGIRENQPTGYVQLGPYDGIDRRIAPTVILTYKDFYDKIMKKIDFNAPQKIIDSGSVEVIANWVFDRARFLFGTSVNKEIEQWKKRMMLYPSNPEMAVRSLGNSINAYVTKEVSQMAQEQYDAYLKTLPKDKLKPGEMYEKDAIGGEADTIEGGETELTEFDIMRREKEREMGQKLKAKELEFRKAMANPNYSFPTVRTLKVIPSKITTMNEAILWAERKWSASFRNANIPDSEAMIVETGKEIDKEDLPLDKKFTIYHQQMVAELNSMIRQNHIKAYDIEVEKMFKDEMKTYKELYQREMESEIEEYIRSRMTDDNSDVATPLQPSSTDEPNQGQHAAVMSMSQSQPLQPLQTTFSIGELNMQSKIFSDDAGLRGQDIDDLNDSGTTTGAIVGGMRSTTSQEEEALRALSTLNNQSDMYQIINVAKQYGITQQEMSDMISLANENVQPQERKVFLINTLGRYIIDNLEQKRGLTEYDFADLPQFQDVQGDDDPIDVSLRGQSSGSLGAGLTLDDLTTLEETQSDTPNIGVNSSVQTSEGMKAGLGTHIHDWPQRKGVLNSKEQFQVVYNEFSDALEKGDMAKADKYMKLILNDDDIDVDELRDSFYDQGEKNLKEQLRSRDKTPQQIDAVVELFKAEAEREQSKIGDKQLITKPRRGRPRKVIEEEFVPPKVIVKQYNSGENLPATEIASNRGIIKYYKGQLTSASNSGNPKELMEARTKYVETSDTIAEGKKAWNKLMTAIENDDPSRTYKAKIKNLNVKFT